MLGQNTRRECRKLNQKLGWYDLYGKTDQLGIALRELIQNARDAVAARQALPDEDVGKVRVQLKWPASGGTYIEIEDDGVGMSERVLTGPFLDFGTSFWISSLVQEEFPGLRSSGFRPVGRFGIGFYSVFMIASEVTISTRRWDVGLDHVRTLKFPKGLTLRPILVEGRPAGFSASTSTKVSCRLKEELPNLSTVKVMTRRLGQADFYVKFADYLAALVAGLDVSVEFRAPGDDQYVGIHRPISDLRTTATRREWLESISFANYVENHIGGDEIASYADRLRPLQDGERIYGLAALSTRLDNIADFLSVQTVGGLATSVHSRHSSQFIGYLDYNANSAKRDAANSICVPPDILENWAEEQKQLLSASNASPWEWCFATCSLCDLDLDPLSVARVVISLNGSHLVMDIPQVFSLAMSGGLGIFKSAHIEHMEYLLRQVDYQSYPIFYPVRNSKFLSLERIGNTPKHKFSFIGCLYRYAKSQGHQLHFEERQSVTQSLLGPLHVLLITVVEGR